MFLPQIKSMQISGHILPVSSLDKDLTGLTAARALTAIAEANGSMADFKQVLPKASNDQVLELTKEAQSARFTAWLKRKVAPYSLDNDTNLLLSDYLKDSRTKKCQLIWS